jgi:hypothetical protein
MASIQMQQSIVSVQANPSGIQVQKLDGIEIVMIAQRIGLAIQLLSTGISQCQKVL